MKVIGLMSGTSADGVDAALVEIHGRGLDLTVRPLAFVALSYPSKLQRRIVSACTKGTVAEICHLNVLLGEWFAKAALQAIKTAGLTPHDIDAIGSHGQTVHHLPNPVREPGVGPIRSTLQIGEPAVIAERTGITTVADFRPRDMAAGGQGAPLAPYAHYLLLRDPDRSRLVVNLGGISNVTYVPAKGGLEALCAFDTGPGNMALDGLMHHLSQGRQAYDRDGRLAARGHVSQALLRRLLAHPYFRKAPPKSTGRELFGTPFVDMLLKEQRRRRLSPEDLLATCALLTAKAVQTAGRWIEGTIDEVIVGGGGAKNRAIMAHMSQTFAPVPVQTFEEAGWESKAFEAIAFAVLAYQTLQGDPANVPAVTGARHPVILGAITPSGVPDRHLRVSDVKGSHVG
jgi:anhydro-N-acetylmuramic acid kinase